MQIANSFHNKYIREVCERAQCICQARPITISVSLVESFDGLSISYRVMSDFVRRNVEPHSPKHGNELSLQCFVCGFIGHLSPENTGISAISRDDEEDHKQLIIWVGGAPPFAQGSRNPSEQTNQPRSRIFTRLSIKRRTYFYETKFFLQCAKKLVSSIYGRKRTYRIRLVSGLE